MHVAGSYISASFYYVVLNRTALHYLEIPHFIYVSTVVGYLGPFHLEDIMDPITMNICVHMSFIFC